MLETKTKKVTKQTLTNPDPSQLQRYKTNDLELFIANSGEVYAHQSAIARTLGLQQGHLSSVLKTEILPDDTAPEPSFVVRLPSERGERELTLYGVSTIIKLAERYNKAVARQFAEVGAKVYLYQLAGYQVGVTTPKPEPSPTEALQLAYESMGRLLRIQQFADDLGGLQAYLSFAEQDGNQQLKGMMTIDQMATYYGYELTPAQNRAIGRSMVGAAESQITGELEVTRKRYKDAKGNWQSFEVKEYPSKLLTLFASICQKKGITKTKEPLTA